MPLAMNLLGLTLEARNSPNSLQAVVKSVLQPICVGMPNPDSAVLGPSQDDRELRVERHWNGTKMFELGFITKITKYNSVFFSVSIFLTGHTYFR